MLRLLHDLQAFLPVVGRHGLLLVVVGIAQDEDVVSPGEGAGVDLDRSQVDVGIGSVRLVAGAAVVVPLWQVLHLGGFRLQHLHLGPHRLPGPVNPHVGGADLLS